MPIALWAMVAGSLAAGPVMLVAAERATGTVLVAPGSTRRAVAAVMSVSTTALCCAGWLKFGTTLDWVAWCWACALACGLVLTDLTCRRLPFRLVVTLAGGVGLVLLGATLACGGWNRFGVACTAAVHVGVPVVLVQMWVPEHTGGGDTALYAALALYLGWFGWDGLLRGLLIATGLTALVALAVAVWSRSMNSQFAAGPSLLAGALASILLA
ncbi:methyltransferase [Amycolatopsis lurida]